MLNLFAKDFNNFGPYDLNWAKYELCRGPRSHNSTSVFTNLTEIGDNLIAYFNITYLEETKIEDIKITVYSLKSNTKSVLWTYKVTDPCKHFSFGGVIKVVFKTPNCVVNKGSYYVYLNLKEISATFLGSSFFYGEYLLKTVITSKNGNILCMIVIDRFSKKT
ncbi:uncharacterized protein LOC113398298 [Vanessa tameamea]|uniref:Uncharacterized protein LOC113398298 n=1 Tax=Vanessa tameamea TaxID=334116 RepID=A0ABM4ALB9_VANTA